MTLGWKARQHLNVNCMQSAYVWPAWIIFKVHRGEFVHHIDCSSRKDDMQVYMTMVGDKTTEHMLTVSESEASD